MQDQFDVAVIGGGVVGCAMLRRFALEGARCILLERGPDILDGASKANSAILHTGFDAPLRSLELACIKAGYAEYMEIRGRLNLPLLETGALLVAWDANEAATLSVIAARARENGIEVFPIKTSELRRREPHLSAAAKAALCVPGEHVIDPWSAPLAYATQAVANGAKMLFNADVREGNFDGKRWSLGAGEHAIRAGWVINCAGLFGDLLDQKLLGKASFAIRPRKGQFLVFDKEAAGLVSSIILPVPGEHSKGIVLCRTVFGNILVGPTAEDQVSRTDAWVTSDQLSRLRKRATEIMPALATVPVTASYAGLRPATERKEYRIGIEAHRNWITVGGIRSTGLTAALGIARHVFRLYSEAGRKHEPVASASWPRVPNIAEHRRRDWQEPGYSRIVCHCELVTQREIETALQACIPARNIAGLKRRTRAMMGRCQGFYCSAEVDAIAGRFIDDRLTVGEVHGH